jgi:hypothetical protein
VVRTVANDEHPSKPGHDHCFGTSFPDYLWNLVIQCWDLVPAMRPEVTHIIREIERANVMNLPSTLFINGVVAVGPGFHVTAGSFADVFRGEWQGQAVAIKRFRSFLSSDSLHKLSKVGKVLEVFAFDADRLTALLSAGNELAAAQASSSGNVARC